MTAIVVKMQVGVTSVTATAGVSTGGGAGYHFVVLKVNLQMYENSDEGCIVYVL